MSNFEMELEVQKVVDLINKKLVIKTDFDNLLIEFIANPKPSVDIEGLFRKYLEASSKEEIKK